MKLKIIMTNHGEGRIWLDDQELSHVAAFSIKASARKGYLNKAFIEIHPDIIEFEAPDVEATVTKPPAIQI